MTTDPVGQFVHDPDAVLDYSIEWRSWLPTGDSISSASWTVPSPLVLVAESLSGSRATVWVSGGVVGGDHRITCHVVTAEGREDDRSIRLVVAER